MVSVGNSAGHSLCCEPCLRNKKLTVVAQQFCTKCSENICEDCINIHKLFPALQQHYLTECTDKSTDKGNTENDTKHVSGYIDPNAGADVKKDHSADGSNNSNVKAKSRENNAPVAKVSQTTTRIGNKVNNSTERSAKTVQAVAKTASRNAQNKALPSSQTTRGSGGTADTKTAGPSMGMPPRNARMDGEPSASNTQQATPRTTVRNTRTTGVVPATRNTQTDSGTSSRNTQKTTGISLKNTKAGVVPPTKAIQQTPRSGGGKPASGSQAKPGQSTIRPTANAVKSSVPPSGSKGSPSVNSGQSTKEQSSANYQASADTTVGNIPEDIGKASKDTQTGGGSSSKDVEHTDRGDSRTTNTDKSDGPLPESAEIGQYDIRIGDERESPDIYGAVVLHGGMTVLTDVGNKKLKLLNTRCSVVDTCELSEPNPWGVCAFGDEVCLAAEEELLFMKVKPSFEKTKRMRVGVRCRGVGYSNGRIYVACGGGGGEGAGQVRIFTPAGKLENTWERDKDTNKLIFTVPLDVALSASGNKIHVVDNNNGIVTFDKQGTILWRYTDPYLRNCHGCCADDKDRVYVCGYWFHNVVQLDTNGQRLRMLLTRRNGIERPLSVCFDPSRKRLLIGMYHGTHIHVFHID